MDEYVSKSTLYGLCGQRGITYLHVSDIDNMPAADVAPVVHGRWEWITQDKYRCNICGRITRVDECMGKPMYSGCPYCRAQMNLGQEEKTNEK